MSAFELLFGAFRGLMLRGPLLTRPPEPLDPSLPVLLVANHASWWDGFILRELQKQLRPGARLFTLMTERELRRHPFLRWMGCVGARPGDGASVLRAFRQLRAERHRHGDTVFAFFPQGRIWPASRRPLGFERGVAVLASWLAPVVVLPVAIHIEPLNRAAPTAFVRVGSPVLHREGRASHRALEAAVESGLDGIRAFLERHGEDAAHHWPPAPVFADPLPGPDRSVGTDEWTGR